MFSVVWAHCMADVFSILHISSVCDSTATYRYPLKSFNPLLRGHNHIFSTYFCINLCQASIKEQLAVCSVYQDIRRFFYNISSGDFKGNFIVNTDNSRVAIIHLNYLNKTSSVWYSLNLLHTFIIGNFRKHALGYFLTTAIINHN